MRAVADQQRGRGARRAALGAVAALVLGLGVAPVAGVLTATPAAAVTVPTGSVEVSLSGHRGTNGAGTADGTDADNSNCIRFNPGPGVWSSSGEVRAAHGRELVESQVRNIWWRDWESAGNQCPNTLGSSRTWSNDTLFYPTRYRTEGQSTISMAAAAPGTVSGGSTFLLGTFRHYNNPIQTTARHYEGTLGLRLGGATLSTPYVLNETPNSATPASNRLNNDTVLFPNLVRTETVVFNGMSYRLSVLGLTTLATGAVECTGTPTSYSNEVSTVEETTTVACLWGRIDQIRPVSVVKQVTAAGDAPGSIPGASFTSSSTLSGSPWAASSFTLTPTTITGAGSSATLGAREFRATGEQLALTEATPATNWSLTSIVCRDGAGEPLASGATISVADRRVVLANVPEAATATAAPITCTFLNTYVAPTTLTLVSHTIPAGQPAVPSSGVPTAGWAFTAGAVGGTLTTAGAGGSATATVPVPGATRVVRVTETVQSGYVFDRVSCRRNDQATAFFVATVNPYDLTLERGRSYTCTVLNLRPAVDLVKQAFLVTDTGFTTPLAAGQERQAGTSVVWRYRVHNTGQTTLSGIVLRDATTVTTNGAGTTNGFAVITCPGIAPGTAVTIPSLAPGQDIHCRASGVL